MTKCLKKRLGRVYEEYERCASESDICQKCRYKYESSDPQWLINKLLQACQLRYSMATIERLRTCTSEIEAERVMFMARNGRI